MCACAGVVADVLGRYLMYHWFVSSTVVGVNALALALFTAALLYLGSYLWRQACHVHHAQVMCVMGWAACADPACRACSAAPAASRLHCRDAGSAARSAVRARACIHRVVTCVCREYLDAHPDFDFDADVNMHAPAPELVEALRQAGTAPIVPAPYRGADAGGRRRSSE